MKTLSRLEIAELISKRLNISFYVGRYKVGDGLLGYTNEWFIFFKIQDLPEKAIRYYRRWNLGFSYSEKYKIFECGISEFSNVSEKYRICHRSEHGRIYTNK